MEEFITKYLKEVGFPIALLIYYFAILNPILYEVIRLLKDLIFELEQQRHVLEILAHLR